MTHDSRCSLAEPCLTAMPTHDCCNNHEDCTACATESGAACFACGNTCQCDLIARIRADEREQTIRDCIAAVDGLSPWRKTDPDEVENALRGLRQP